MLVLSRVIPKLRAVWVVVAVTLFYASPSSSIGNRSIQETKSTPSASLILTTAITGQTYCSNGNVQLFLRLKFTNSGTETIILQKYSVVTTGYSVSRSLEAAKKRQYESVVTLFQNVATFKPTHGRKPPSDRFVILAPAESYEFDSKSFQFAFTVYNRDHSKPLKEGAHFIQFDNLWLLTDTAAKEVL
jgi:hypothetical protein